MFKELDQILKSRKKLDAPEGLSARVIAAAAQEPRVEAVYAGFDLRSALAEIQALFSLPRPAYAFAVVALFIFGALVGASADPLGFLPGVTADDLASFMLIEDGFVAGEWV